MQKNEGNIKLKNIVKKTFEGVDGVVSIGKSMQEADQKQIIETLKTYI